MVCLSGRLRLDVIKISVEINYITDGLVEVWSGIQPICLRIAVKRFTTGAGISVLVTTAQYALLIAG